jgi:hypothetical protein
VDDDLTRRENPALMVDLWHLAEPSPDRRARGSPAVIQVRRGQRQQQRAVQPPSGYRTGTRCASRPPVRTASY